jgi:hypothetical protein
MQKRCVTLLISKSAKVKISAKILRYYQDKGYTCSVGSILTVDIKDLTKGSSSLVKVVCDYCKEKEFEIKYKTYIKQKNNSEIKNDS